jgi:hypothetical protein
MKHRQGKIPRVSRGARLDRLVFVGVLAALVAHPSDAFAQSFATCPPLQELAGAARSEMSLAARHAEGLHLHQEGLRLMSLTSPNTNGALANFLRAYELLEGHPERNVDLRNIGRCYQMLLRYDLAIYYYRRDLEEGSPAEADRVRSQARIEALEGTLGSVTIETNVSGAEVWIDSHCYEPVRSQVRIPAGRHRIELRAPGHLPGQREVDVASRQPVTMRIDLERLARGTPRWLFWSSFGGTALAAGVGLAFTMLAWDRRTDLEPWINHNDRSMRLRVTEADQQQITTHELVSYIGYGVAGVFAIATTVLYFTDESRRLSPNPRRSGVILVPLAQWGGAGMLAHGAF